MKVRNVCSVRFYYENKHHIIVSRGNFLKSYNYTKISIFSAKQPQQFIVTIGPHILLSILVPTPLVQVEIYLTCFIYSVLSDPVRSNAYFPESVETGLKT